MYANFRIKKTRKSCRINNYGDVYYLYLVSYEISSVFVVEKG